jgi:hypothetical protein
MRVNELDFAPSGNRDEELVKNAERCAMINRAKANGWQPKARIARSDLDIVVERALAGSRSKGSMLADSDIDAAIASLRRAA